MRHLPRRGSVCVYSVGGSGKLGRVIQIDGSHVMLVEITAAFDDRPGARPERATIEEVDEIGFGLRLRGDVVPAARARESA